MRTWRGLGEGVEGPQLPFRAESCPPWGCYPLLLPPPPQPHCQAREGRAVISLPFPPDDGEPLSKPRPGQRPRSRCDLWAATWCGRSWREAGRGKGRASPELSRPPVFQAWLIWGGEGSGRRVGKDSGSSAGTGLGRPGLGSMCKRDLVCNQPRGGSS